MKQLGFRQRDALAALEKGPVDSRDWAKRIGKPHRNAHGIFRSLERLGLVTLAGPDNNIFVRK